jgi:hypothetical protein
MKLNERVIHHPRKIAYVVQNTVRCRALICFLHHVSDTWVVTFTLKNHSDVLMHSSLFDIFNHLQFKRLDQYNKIIKSSFSDKRGKSEIRKKKGEGAHVRSKVSVPNQDFHKLCYGKKRSGVPPTPPPLNIPPFPRLGKKYHRAETSPRPVAFC